MRWWHSIVSCLLQRGGFGWAVCRVRPGSPWGCAVALKTLRQSSCSSATLRWWPQHIVSLWPWAGVPSLLSSMSCLWRVGRWWTMLPQGVVTPLMLKHMSRVGGRYPASPQQAQPRWWALNRTIQGCLGPWWWPTHMGSGDGSNADINDREVGLRGEGVEI